MDEDAEDYDELVEIIGNTKLTESFRRLATELDVMEPKSPEDVYKSHLADAGGSTAETDGTTPESSRSNIAATYVNALVNMGFGVDKLVTVKEEASGRIEWLYKHKADGKLGTKHFWGGSDSPPPSFPLICTAFLFWFVFILLSTFN
jgi:26S proteasome regulatory subunit N1